MLETMADIKDGTYTLGISCVAPKKNKERKKVKDVPQVDASTSTSVADLDSTGNAPR